MMEKTNTSSFGSDDILAEIFKSLAHPARIAIIRQLLENESCNCGEIVSQLPLSQSTVSQHLAAMKRSGIVRGTIDGPRVCYCIDAKVWQEAGDAIQNLFTKEAPSLQDCDC